MGKDSRESAILHSQSANFFSLDMYFPYLQNVSKGLIITIGTGGNVIFTPIPCYWLTKFVDGGQVGSKTTTMLNGYKDAYRVLKEISDSTVVDDAQFEQWKKDFNADYLKAENYEERLENSRVQKEYKHSVTRKLNDYLLKIQQREEMRDYDPEENSHWQVHARVRKIWDDDKRIKTTVQAISIYCKSRGKDILITAVHMAEYLALQELFTEIDSSIYKAETMKQNKVTPKYFEIERRETYGKDYLNVALRNADERETIAGILRSLHSVKKVNLTNQPSGKLELTVYPARAYDISETEQEVQLALDNYFKGSPVDPSFKAETISGISEKAYSQIMDYMLVLGKELEKFQKLNTNFDEERYRDYFIPQLNAITQNYSTRAEAFNRNGKTDILFADNNGNNVFIAECKIWKGPAYLTAAIDQLLNNYVNWRDEKVAIVIFNKDNKKFSEVIDSAISTVASHPLCLKDLGKRKDTSYSFLFRHPDDEKKTIKLELVLFNFA